MAGVLRVGRARLVHGMPEEPVVSCALPATGVLLAAWDPARLRWTAVSHAHYDPWTQGLTLGRRWQADTLLSRHVLWHELAHTRQPRGRALWASQPWMVALAAAAVAGLTVVPPWNVPGAVVMVALWGRGSLWPLETQADHQAGVALTVWSRATLPAAEAAAVEGWVGWLACRHRWALALEWAMYAAVAAAASGLVAAFAHP